MRPLLLAASAAAYNGLELGRRREDVEVRHVPALPSSSSLDGARATVVLVDEALLATAVNPEKRLMDLARVAAIVGRGRSDVPDDAFPSGVLTSFLPADASDELVRIALQGALRHATALRDERTARTEAERRQAQLIQLSEVGVALATERNLSRLLGRILSEARRLTSCDAATLYLVEHDEDGVPSALRARMTQNQSRPSVTMIDVTLPLDHTSLAGYVATTGEALSIPDVTRLPQSLPYSANRLVDARTGYHSRSMLVLPLVSHREQVVGVLQLINRKRNQGAILTGVESVDAHVIPFTLDVLEPASALAAHAAVAIENGVLHGNIEQLFEGFVTAAVEAIDARDPSTAGHSSRVARLAVAFAEALSRASDGPYAGTVFREPELRELRYAALLHDFGKVAVSEEVLLKQRKLHPADLASIRHRIEGLHRLEDVHFEQLRADWLLDHGRRGYAEREAQLRADRLSRQAFLRDFLRRVESLNSGLESLAETELASFLATRFEDATGVVHPLLTDRERSFLGIFRGTLDENERRELEAHVLHTDRFLRRIPWTPELSGVPDIALSHHEKLDGSGYPHGVRAEAIPLRTRLITIADVFDALTSADRPYRDAMSVEQALDTLHSEALAGELDMELLRVFRESRVWEALDGEGRGNVVGRQPSAFSRR